MTRLVRFANNAASRLAASLNAVSTTCSVTPGDGAKFPILSAGQYFMATLVRADGTKEIVRVTNRATDTFTIVRAAEAVAGIQAAATFSAGDRIELRMTAGSLASELDRLDAAALVGVTNQSANYTVTAADISTLIRMDCTGGNRTVTLPAISTLTDDFQVLISKVSNDPNNLIVAGSGGNLINGLATLTLQQQWNGAWLIADRATNTWTAINSGGGGNAGGWTVDAFTGSGAPGPFNLSADPGSKFNTMVWVGGVYQQKSTYTLVGTVLTLGGNVPAGVGVEVAYSSPVSFGIPNDGAVTAPKLGDLAVTTPKIADQAVTVQKIQNMPTRSLVGRGAAGTGPAQEVVVGGGLQMGDGTLSNPSGQGLPLSDITSGTLAVADAGELVPMAAGVTIPAGVFSPGQTVTLYNNTALSQTITQGAGLTLRLVGSSTTGNRALAARGLATVVFITASEAVISGGGLS